MEANNIIQLPIMFHFHQPACNLLLKYSSTASVRCYPARLCMFVVQCFKPPTPFLFIPPAAGIIEIVYSECVSHFTLTRHSILDVWDLSGMVIYGVIATAIVPVFSLRCSLGELQGVSGELGYLGGETDTNVCIKDGRW